MRIFNKNQISDNLSHLYIVASMILFWTIFDTILMYLTPVILTGKGLSNSIIGSIIASSSVFGALFDIFLCKFLNKSSFKKIFLYMFILSIGFPILLVSANTIIIFILAMAVWGIYFDLYGIGIFNFVGKTLSEKNHSTGFGIIQVFRSIGLFFGPLIVGITVGEKLISEDILFSIFFLGIAFIFFLILLFKLKNKQINYHEHKKKKRNIILELNIVNKLSHKLISPLLITFFLFFVEAFFWTLGPLVALQGVTNISGGFFIAAYTFPAIFIGFFVGNITSIFGKKRTSIYSIFFGSIFLLLMYLFNNSILIFLFIFLASLSFGIALPSINGAYADYIHETNNYTEEIETLEDFSFNLAYIFGPLSAGILSDSIGLIESFGILGLLGIVLVIILFKITPKSISVRKL